jgi:CRISPR-associated protein Csb2
MIVAPQAYASVGYKFFVPNNDGDKKPNRQDRLTSKIALSHLLPDEQTLHYLWPVEATEWDASAAHIHSLTQEARNVLALGWGIDMAVGNGQILSANEVQSLVGERWLPHEVDSLVGSPSRAPVENTLSNLVEVYQAGLNRLANRTFTQPPALTAYRTVRYLKKTSLPPRPTVAFALTPITDDAPRPALPQEDIVQVAGMLRHIAYERAKRDVGFEFPGGVDLHVAGHKDSGNMEERRFAYLPLPSIGHPKSDGKIRRVLIAGSYGCDGVQIRWAEQRLRGVQLIGERTQKSIAALTTPTDSDSVVQLYTGLSDSWASVTPVILPGFDEGKYKKAQGLVAKAIVQSGISLDAIADVTLRKAPFWPSSQHPAHYFRPKYLQRHSAWHAHILFREPIDGPLAIGSGRFCGLGLFAPFKS